MVCLQIAGFFCSAEGVEIVFNHVVIGVDGSPMTPRLLRSVRDLHAVGTRSVSLVWVVDFDAVAVASEIQDEYLKELALYAEETSGYGFRVRYSAPVGSPARELVKCSVRENADLIVIGSHGRSVAEELFLGSTAAEVVRISSVPTLIERPLPVGEEESSALTDRFRRVLLATDLSPQAEPATQKVRALAEAYTGLEALVALTVIDPGEVCGDLAEAEETARMKLHNLLDEVSSMSADVQTMAWVGTGRPARHIIGIAEEYDITLIVLGTKGKGRFRDILLGSTAQQVATRARRPVLLVPRRDSDDQEH